MTAIRLEVQLWVIAGQFEAFRTFEENAMQIMARHGGTVLEIRQNHTAPDGAPHEVHILEFPSQAHFAQYREDPDLLAMAHQRAKCIARTQVTTL